MAKAFFTPDELVERIGGKVTTETLANWRYYKRGPAWVKYGGHVRYRIADVEAYEKAQRVETAA
jgi:hypothetical protein